MTCNSALTGREPVFAGTGLLFADFAVLPFPGPSTLAMGSRGSGLEAEMTEERKAAAKWRGWWTAAFWFAGVTLFMVQLSAGLDYVQARFAALAPNFLGCLPALGLAAWKVAEATFWNCGQLEATFRMTSFATLPFVLVGLAMSMRQRIGF
jgi:hypothetical protein